MTFTDDTVTRGDRANYGAAGPDGLAAAGVTCAQCSSSSTAGAQAVSTAEITTGRWSAGTAWVRMPNAEAVHPAMRRRVFWEMVTV